jgi:non-ribosomal peptide synthase protein (TIGR01720 family)
MKDIREQVAKLSDQQRLLLSRRLRMSDVTNTKHRLVAFVTVNGSARNLDSHMLRDFLREELPSFMVPEVVTILESLPRLPNGKVDLRSLPDLPAGTCVEADELVGPRNETEQLLAKIWSEILHLDVLSVHDNFFEVGGDSIISIQLISRARQAGLNIEPRHLADYPTVAGLATVATSAATSDVSVRRATGDAPLTPIQHWFVSRNLRVPHHWNQARLFEVDPRVTPAILTNAIQGCIAHHDALRARFQLDADAKWQSVPPAESSSPLEVVQITDPDPAHQLNQHVAQRQTEFDLGLGPLMRFTLFQFGQEKPSRLLVIAHHLVIDHLSWTILCEDLERACQQLLVREEVSFPPKTTSLVEWAQRLSDYADSDACGSSVAYWTATMPLECARIPTDHIPEREPDEASADTVTRILDESDTRMLRTLANEAYRTRTHELLITAVTQSLTRWTGWNAIRIDLEGHGRDAIFEDVDLARSIGWFTTFFPVTLDLARATGPGETIKTVKEQLRAIPRQGLDHGILRYLSRDAELVQAISAMPMASVLFNYLGSDASAPSAATLLKELGGANESSRHPSNQRSHLLEINAGVTDQRLAVSWTYSRLVHERATIERLAWNCHESLLGLIEHCTSAGGGGFTPSDFPEADLSQEDLDAFLEGLE